MLTCCSHDSSAIGNVAKKTKTELLLILIHKSSEMSDTEIMIVHCGVKCVIFFVQPVNLLTANQSINSMFYSWTFAVDATRAKYKMEQKIAASASLESPGDAFRGLHHPLTPWRPWGGSGWPFVPKTADHFGLNSAPLLGQFSKVSSGIFSSTQACLKLYLFGSFPV